ncbi:MAG: FeoB-associated Cys-rich membrane protein [Acutalibacteraceae bacterium]|nr:FeoB-associated Cys-rich membrane protein [Acutalibacteraceae bacterium]
MISWFVANIGTIILCLVLVVIVALIISNMIKNKKQGKTSCGCGCQNCPMSGSCHSKK